MVILVQRFLHVWGKQDHKLGTTFYCMFRGNGVVILVQRFTTGREETMWQSWFNVLLQFWRKGDGDPGKHFTASLEKMKVEPWLNVLLHENA